VRCRAQISVSSLDRIHRFGSASFGREAAKNQPGYPITQKELWRQLKAIQPFTFARSRHSIGIILCNSPEKSNSTHVLF